MSSSAIEQVKLFELKEAFANFSQASSRLEEEYQALTIEAEQLRAELRRKDEEIKRVERLSTLGQTAARLAHEIRNPLGALRLYVSLLEQGANKPPAPEVVGGMVNCIASLESVVSTILQFAKNKSLTFAPLNLASVLEQAVSEVISTLKPPAFKVERSFANAPFLIGNEGALRQAFANIIRNSCEAMRGSGILQIGVELASAGQVRIIFKDNGPGLSEGILTRLFEPFATSKEEGTGLGMAIVQQTIEHHGGSVEAYNDNGAVIVCELPQRPTRS